MKQLGVWSLCDSGNIKPNSFQSGYKQLATNHFLGETLNKMVLDFNDRQFPLKLKIPTPPEPSIFFVYQPPFFLSLAFCCFSSKKNKKNNTTLYPPNTKQKQTTTTHHPPLSVGARFPPHQEASHIWLRRDLQLWHYVANSLVEPQS